MNTASTKKGYCALMFGALLTVISPVASATTANKTIHNVMKANGKPTAPIEVAYTVPKSAAIGASVSVVVTIRPLSDVTDLNLKITAGEGLSLSTGDFVRNYGAQKRDAVLSETITAVVNAQGILYLNVFTSGAVEGKTMSSASAVPISVGDSPKRMLKKSGRTEHDASGRPIIVMPAEERK